MDLCNVCHHTFLNKKFDLVIDLGANKGEFIKRIKAKRKIAIEPNPFLFKELKIKEKICLAIGGTTRIGYLSIQKEDEASNIYGKMPLGMQAKLMKIEIMSLNDLFTQLKLDSVDLLKVDIEGAEWETFLKCSNETIQKCEQISIEFHNFNTKLNPFNWIRTLKVIYRISKLGYIFYSKGLTMTDVLFIKRSFYDKAVTGF